MNFAVISSRRAAVVTLVAATFLACQACVSTPSATSLPADAGANAIAALPPKQLQQVLAEMARAHQQKIDLAFWTSTPFKSVDPGLKPFFTGLGKIHKPLLDELKKWAKAHHIDLTFHYSPDIFGEGQKIMEDAQKKIATDDDKTDFERDTLMNMYTDFQWQISLIHALLPRVRDPGLQAYLGKSLRAHEDGSNQIRGLLKKYKFTP